MKMRLSEKHSLPTASIHSGARYGNRTRLCGLGSDRSTDELTLHLLSEHSDSSIIIPFFPVPVKNIRSSSERRTGNYRDDTAFSVGQDLRSAAQEIKKLASQPAGTASQTNAMPKRGAQIRATDRRIARFTMFAARNGRMIPSPRRTPSVAILMPIKIKKQPSHLM